MSFDLGLYRERATGGDWQVWTRKPYTGDRGELLFSSRRKAQALTFIRQYRRKQAAE